MYFWSSKFRKYGRFATILYQGIQARIPRKTNGYLANSFQPKASKVNGPRENTVSFALRTIYKVLTPLVYQQMCKKAISKWMLCMVTLNNMSRLLIGRTVTSYVSCTVFSLRLSKMQFMLLCCINIIFLPMIHMNKTKGFNIYMIYKPLEDF